MVRSPSWSSSVKFLILDIAFEHYARAKRARVEATHSMSTEAQSCFRYLQRSVASTSRNVEANFSRIIADVRPLLINIHASTDTSAQSSKLAESAHAYHGVATDHLAAISQATHVLADKGVREDVPTGGTPQKRVREIVDHWELTESRDKLLQDWRQTASVSASSSTSTSSLSVLSQEGRENFPPIPIQDAEDIVRGSESPQVSPQCQAPEPPTTTIDASSCATILPLPSTLHVSLESTVTSMPPAKGKLKHAKPEYPAMGTLTERSTNLISNRRTRKHH